MANRFIGGVLSSRPQANTPFSSRASTGTYFDSAGVLRTAPINQPRLNYNFVGSAWTQPTVLIEPASTNFLTYSEDLSNGAWANNNSITTNQAAAPDGTTTADLIYPSSSGNWSIRYQQNPTGTTANTTGYTYTISVFAKASGKSWLFLGDDNATTRGIWFNVSTGVIGTRGSAMTNGRIDPVGNSWYRCQVTYITNGVVRNLMAITDADNSASVTASGSNGILIWGAQLEERFTATSYIPTTTAAVTRAADVVGPGTSGIYSLEDRQNTTAVDDQSTVQSFTSTGSTTWTAPADVTSVEVLVVAGGGGGAYYIGGGGGAGGLLYNTQYAVVPGTTYPVVVGAGGLGVGSATPASINNGRNSQFGNLIAIGGGQGGSGDPGGGPGGNHGGSGGGQGRRGGDRGGVIGQGVPGQGFSGGAGAATGSNDNLGTGGGGGGAGGPGLPANTSAVPGNGGPGLYFTISGTSTAYAGGGGGGAWTGSDSVGGVGGGGAGSGTAAGTAGTANTGGGGGSAGYPSPGAGGGAGGSGIVIVKYKRTPKQIASTSNAAIVTQKFSTTNLWTVPAGVTQVEALVVAGGGGGGAPGGSGGGAGGLQYYSTYPVTPGGSCSVVIGAGGVGGVYNTSPGGQGGSSMFATSAANIVTNGSFDTDTGWTHTLTSIANGYMYLNAGSQPRPTSSSFTSATGSYLLTWTVISNPGGHSANIDDDGAGAGVGSVTTYVSGISAVGVYSAVVSKTASTRLRILGSGTFTSSMVFDNVFMYPVSSIISTTGGGGGGGNGASAVNANGGSGAGAAPSYVGGSAGTGIAGQGNAGGASASIGYGGGGGAGGAGTAGNDVVGSGKGGNGGPGLPFNITGNLEYYAGGGGGGVYTPTGTLPGYGGIGGGGNGVITNAPYNAGAPNTGGGGGGVGGGTGAGGPGGSGVVVLRYRVPQVATFLDSGSWTCPAGVTSVQALIVAGGGAGGSDLGGGGGAGGVVYDNSIPVTPGVTYPIVVGQGGTTTADAGNNGQNSNFANIIAIGGGGGGSGVSTNAGRAGGSGGGARVNRTNQPGGAGVYAQGNAGGGALNLAAGTGYGASGGGGGAGGVGAAGSQTAEGSAGTGDGGIGLAFSISGSSTYYGGGGGACSVLGTSYIPAGGLGGGAAGIRAGSSTPGNNATANTGGGGGGGGNGYTGATGSQGGSGIVILRWSGA